jgi:adenosyl cobinamide kinase/adenosyl cobinamide phosphate guanylyltransferase
MTTKDTKEIKYQLNKYNNVFTLDITVYTIVQGLKMLQTLQSDKLQRLAIKAGLDIDISIIENIRDNGVLFMIIITAEEGNDMIENSILVKKYRDKIEAITSSIQL